MTNCINAERVLCISFKNERKMKKCLILNLFGIFRAMELLNECNLLKIEDILPFFPDFVTIDQFKVYFLVLFLCLYSCTLSLCVIKGISRHEIANQLPAAV